MKIQFLFKNSQNLYLFESSIRKLITSGHHVTVAFTEKTENVAEAFPYLSNVNWEEAVTPTSNEAKLASLTSSVLDWLKYLDQKYEKYPELKATVQKKVRGRNSLFFKFNQTISNLLGQKNAILSFQKFLVSVPVDSSVLGYLRQKNVDLFVLSPFVDLDVSQIEYLRVANYLKIPTVIAPDCWDCFSNQGLLRLPASAIIAWNESQKKELIDQHKVPSERIRISGSPYRDLINSMKPTYDREEFFKQAGLDPQRPYILYLGSRWSEDSVREPKLIAELSQKLKLGGDELSRFQILVHPHPGNPDHLCKVKDNVDRVIFPRSPRLQNGILITQDFYDSIYYSSAVVGVDPTVLSEASEFNKPFGLIRDSRFKISNEPAYQIQEVLGKEKLPLFANILEFTESLKSFSSNDSGRDPSTVISSRNSLFSDEFEKILNWTHEKRESLPTTIISNGFFGKVSSTAVDLVSAIVSFKGKLQQLGLKSRPQLSPSHSSAAIGSNPMGTKIGLFSNISGFSGGWSGYDGDPGYVKILKDYETKFLTSIQSISNKNVIIGPWTSEVGYEVLYWIPFLRKLKELGIYDPKRATVLTRGGAAVWYEGLCSQAIDIFSIMSVEEFRRIKLAEVDKFNSQKHMQYMDSDETIIRAAGLTDKLKSTGFELIHPSLMYGYLQPLTGGKGGRAPLSLARRMLKFNPLNKPNAVDLSKHLPEKYIAMKFYFRDSFEDSGSNREFLYKLISNITEKHHLVLLNTGMEFDDHSEWLADRGDRIHRVDSLMVPENNLAVQTQVIAGAQGFIGTYGGMSYLPLHFNVPTLAFVDGTEKLHWTHRHLANEMAVQLDTPFIVLKTSEYTQFRNLFG